MSNLSPLQILPLHVVRIIVEHAVGSSRLKYAGIEANSREYKVLLRPLLWVSHNFRAIAYPLFCKSFKLELAKPKLSTFEKLVASTTTVYRPLSDPEYPLHRLAEELKIDIFGQDIYSGKALEILSSVPYDGCAFPVVRKIEFLIYFKKRLGANDGEPVEAVEAGIMGSWDDHAEDDSDDDNDNDEVLDPVDVAANIKSFVQRIKDMAPRLCGIAVSLAVSGRRGSISNDCNDLISRLFQLSNRLAFSGYSILAIPIELDQNRVSGLVHIEYGSQGGISMFVELVCRNAATLRSLSMSHKNGGADLGALIQDSGAGSGYTIYPDLHTLELHAWKEQDADEPKPMTVSRSTVPFPSLRRVHMWAHYPFGDDTLFRGNADILEDLRVMLDSHTVAILKKHRVFTPTSHPKLQSVNVAIIGDRISSMFTTTAQFVQFALSIGPEASVREFGGCDRVVDFIPALPILGDYACVQVLTLAFIDLDLLQMVALIQSLPLLSDLTTGPPNLGPIPAGLAQGELPVYMVKTYAPMGERFRCWRLTYIVPNYDDEVIMCVLLLALVCPNFDYACPGSSDCWSLARQMERRIGKPAFSQYASRLRRLLLTEVEWRKI
ncbi:hypothetical protein GGH95_003475, partial [Coemansia sp. RSA 1836]